MANAKMKGHVFLVGFMGAGKSSVARRIARTCGVTSLDMDSYIERSQGKPIRDIFAEGGERAFRAIETDTLRELASRPDPLVISCGGGAVLAPENRRIMGESGHVVHLAVDADEAASRISNKSTRPLFRDIASARELCEQRMPIYEEAADFTVDTAGKNVPAIARELIAHLKDEGILERS